MQMPTALRKLDDRVLGRKDGGGRGSRVSRDSRSHDPGGGAPVHERSHDEVYPDEREGGSGTSERRASGGKEPEGSSHRPAGDVVREVLGVVWTVSRYVFLALALVVLAGIALTYAPTNDDNVIVRNVLELAAWATGPFEDVFTADQPKRELLYNYALAAAVYLLLASLVTKLPGKRGVS